MPHGIYAHQCAPRRAGEAICLGAASAPVADVRFAAHQHHVIGRHAHVPDAQKFPVAVSSSSKRFERFPQTYSRWPSGDTASPDGISALRRGALAGGNGRVNSPTTLDAFSTPNTLMLPLTLAK